MTATTERVIDVLAEVAQSEEVRRDVNLRLFDRHVLDSLQTIELILALSTAFGVEISPAEFDRDEWATPQMIAEQIDRRLGE